jgi:hypothetical protein
MGRDRPYRKATRQVFILRLTTAILSGRVRNVGKEVKCYTATTFFLCETHYRKATVEYGGVAVQ